jgi:hypothetical protein
MLATFVSRMREDVTATVSLCSLKKLTSAGDPKNKLITKLNNFSNMQLTVLFVTCKLLNYTAEKM